MTEEYVDPEFPEMESQPEEISEFEENPESEVWGEEFYEESPLLDEFKEQMDLIESSPGEQDVLSEQEYPSQAVSTVMSQDSGGVLFLPDDDPIQHPVISEPLDPRLVYTRSVPKRLRHLTCERRGSEYSRPTGIYRPRG
jgi:hypothetical protein